MAIDNNVAALRQISGLFADGTATGLADSELLDRFLAQGDAAAFEALQVRHGPMVMSVCRGILRNPNDAEDAFQATFWLLAAASELIQGVLKSMFVSTLKLGSAIALLGVAFVGSVAVVAQQSPATGNAQPAAQQVPKSASKEPPVVERRVINKKVSDFPDKTDLSTPETAQAAWFRTSARMDDQALQELSWLRWGPRDFQQMQRIRKRDPKETEVFNKAQLNAEILEVTIFRKRLGVSDQQAGLSTSESRKKRLRSMSTPRRD